MSNTDKVVFHFNKGDDGCISIEFVWNDKRACIFFEPKVEESSWCYVEKENTDNWDGHILPEELIQNLKELFTKQEC